MVKPVLEPVKCFYAAGRVSNDLPRAVAAYTSLLTSICRSTPSTDYAG